MPICKSIINFLTFQKPIQLTIPRGLWPHKFLSDILIWRGPNLEKCTREIIVRCPIKIWGLRSAQIKKLKKTDPNFFWKKIRVCFLQLFYRSTPKASNCNPNSRDYFTRNIFIILAPENLNILKKLYGHNPLGMLNHIGFQNFKKVEFWLKNRHVKNVV